MSRYSYMASRDVLKSDPPFYALIMAAMRKADTGNLAKLRSVFPEVAEELETRYRSIGGFTPDEEGFVGMDR